MNRLAGAWAARGVALAWAAVLGACGGGSDADAPPAPAPSGPCATAGTAYATHAKAGTTVGQLGAVTIAGCAGPVHSPRWVQTGGPPVLPLVQDKAQTIAFEPLAPATYRFRVDFRDAAGVARSEQVMHEVAAAPSPTRLALRLSQSVRMGGNVSVRAWPVLQADEAVQSITWSQAEGPAVALDTSDSHVALFKAPVVARDTLIRLRATLLTTAGRSASDEAVVLVEHHAQADAADPGALWRGNHVSRVIAWRPDGPYAGVLARCVYDTGLRDDGVTSNLCPLSQLPFLAQETGGALPSVEQVMDRVLVSHDWAGRNFEAFLRAADTTGDFRRMLMSVTAIVIGAQVRPSFYYAATGAIYLDADNFWLTPEERDTVNEAPDYRSNFGAALQYTALWRYVAGNTNIFRFHDPRQRVRRDESALLDEAGWLMLHELAHALDFLPPSAYASLTGSRSAWGQIAPRLQAGQLASDLVPAAHPLASVPLQQLAQVRFFGATASAEQVAYAPQQVAAFFSADLATDDYAYASRREDVALALEEILMSRIARRRDFAITPRWGPGATGSTVAVTWGQRGRIGEPALRPRLRAIVQQLTPWLDPTEVDRLPAPIAMRAGDSWTANLTLPGPPAPTPRLEKVEPTLQELWLLEQAERRRHRLQPMSRPLPRAGWPLSTRALGAAPAPAPARP